MILAIIAVISASLLIGYNIGMQNRLMTTLTKIEGIEIQINGRNSSTLTKEITEFAVITYSTNGGCTPGTSHFSETNSTTYFLNNTKLTTDTIITVGTIVTSFSSDSSTTYSTAVFVSNCS
jgi:hypothetical protein